MNLIEESEWEYINLYDSRWWLEMALVSCPADTLKTLPASINETKLTLYVRCIIQFQALSHFCFLSIKAFDQQVVFDLITELYFLAECFLSHQAVILLTGQFYAKKSCSVLSDLKDAHSLAWIGKLLWLKKYERIKKQSQMISCEALHSIERSKTFIMVNRIQKRVVLL